MKRTILGLLLVGILFSFAVPDKESEKFMQDLRQCTEAVKKNRDTDLEIGYKVYHSATDKVAAESASGKFCKKGEKTYYSLLGTTFIRDKEMEVMIDDSTHRVLVRKPGKNFNPVEQQMNPGYLKAFTKKISSTEKDGRVYYQLEMKDGEISAMGVSINRTKKNVEKIELFYAHQVEIISEKGEKTKVLPRLEITYKETSHMTPATIFDTRSIIQKSKKGFTLASRYKKYQLIDQYHNKTR